MPAELHVAHALLPGHPDARADVLADALVDAAVALDAAAACEVSVLLAGSTLTVAGFLPAGVDVSGVARSIFPEASVKAETSAAARDVGQHGVALGYAVDEPGTNDLPAEFWLARQIALRLSDHAGELLVMLESEGRPTRLAGFSLGLTTWTANLERTVRAILQDELSHLARRVPGFDSRLPESIAIQQIPTWASAGSNRWSASGAYGPRAPMVGPGLHGKDLAHPDRALPILARRLARAVVRAGVAQECRATLTRVPGQDDALIAGLHGDGQRLDPSRWGELLDRSLPALGRRYSGKVTLAEVARAGHFLREDWPWERIRLE